MDLGFTFVKSAGNIIKLFFQSRCYNFHIYNRHFENSEWMGRVWFSVHSQLTPLQIERHANVMQLWKTSWKWRPLALWLCYAISKGAGKMKKGKMKKTLVRQVIPSQQEWKRQTRIETSNQLGKGFCVVSTLQWNQREKIMFCQYCVKFPNSKNEKSSFRKGSNK